VTLKIGAPVETVTVESETTVINYDNGTLQGGADPETLKDLPLMVEGKPRSSAALALLLPGISSGGGDQAFQARINGGQESGDEALLDGAHHARRLHESEWHGFHSPGLSRCPLTWFRK